MTGLEYTLKLLSENVGIIVALIAAYSAFKINDHKKTQDKKIEIYDELVRDLGEIAEISLKIQRITKKFNQRDQSNKNEQILLFEEKFEDFRIRRARYQLYMHNITYNTLHNLISHIEYLQTKRKQNHASIVGEEKANLTEKQVFEDIFNFASLYLLQNKSNIERDIKNKKFRIKLIKTKIKILYRKICHKIKVSYEKLRD